MLATIPTVSQKLSVGNREDFVAFSFSSATYNRTTKISTVIKHTPITVVHFSNGVRPKHIASANV